MATNRILLGIICLVLFSVSGLPIGGAVALREQTTKNKAEGLRIAELAQRKQLVATALTQLGVRELTGNNDGLPVERYLTYTGHRKGAPWCAAFISWVFGQNGFAQPRTAWSPALFPLHRQTTSPKPADVYGIYFPNLGRIAHCGLLLGQKDSWLIGIEGNTHTDGSREGNGVYKKLRHKRNIKVYANWLSPKESEVQHEN